MVFHVTAKGGSAAILPDDGAIDRLAGIAIPDDGRLALVSDPDGRDAVRIDIGFGHDIATGLDHRSP